MEGQYYHKKSSNKCTSPLKDRLPKTIKNIPPFLYRLKFKNQEDISTHERELELQVNRERMMKHSPLHLY